MTRKRTTRTPGTSKRTQLDKLSIVTLAVVMIVAIAGVLYAVTGTDPFGLVGKGSEILEEIGAPTATPTPKPPWWQVYFTDPLNSNDPENLAGTIPERLIEYIYDAEETIHIASFEFNLDPVAEALIAAHERGVEVQWITDDEYGLDADWEEGHGQFEMLKDADIEVRDDGRGALMHNKFWIFDGQTVWTGSTNITVNGVYRNNNNVLVIDSPEVAAIYEREFDELWAGEFGPTSPSTVEDQSVTIDGTPIQILFAAEDEVMDHLIPLVGEAASSIHFMAFAFTHDGLANAMLARAKVGVDVQGIFETRASDTEYSELSMMHCAGLSVRQDGNPRTFHHKVIIIDKRTVVTGSFNFSDNANDSNDENVVIITNKKIAAEYLREFERRWAEGEEPGPDDVSCN